MKNKIIVLLALALLIGIAPVVGSASAYFTDKDTTSNTFIIGNIALELKEPSWNDVNARYIEPKQSIPRDPQVTNTGSNPEYVFIEVMVPVADVQTAGEDGTVNAAAAIDLFTYTINDSEWDLVTSARNTDTASYVYAYAKNGAMTVLEKNTTSASLFNSVEFANVASGQGLDGASVEMKINAYAIQTTSLYADGDTTPLNVWNIVKAGLSTP